MQTRLHMSCIEMDVLPCDWAYDAPKISWTHIKSCAGLDNDNEATSHIALFLLSLIETQKKIVHGAWYHYHEIHVLIS